MRSTMVIALATAIVLLGAMPARACDPYWDPWCDWYDPYWDPPAYEEPAAYAWAPEPYDVFDLGAYAGSADPSAWAAPSTDVLDASVVLGRGEAAATDAAAAAVALGLHPVTEVWTGHSVTSAGAVTTFSSTSTAFEAGTAARLVATVGTGEATPYDLVVLGGRMALGDGRVVAGDVYENYVWNGYEWVVNAYVFFQDDSELARVAQQTAAATPVLEVPTVWAVATPAATSAPSPAAAPPAAHVAPAIEPPVAPTPPSLEDPARETTQTRRAVRAGLALAPQADILGRIEVLRGRGVPLWVRAIADGVPARVIAWHVQTGEVTVLGPISGSGDGPILASWRTMPAAGSSFFLVVRATVEVPGEAARDVDATVEVIVRSPAIVE